eukprot:6831970-Prymnesium_polylepis.1
MRERTESSFVVRCPLAAASSSSLALRLSNSLRCWMIVANTAARSCAVCCRKRRRRSSDCGSALADAPPVRSHGCCSICSTVSRSSLFSRSRSRSTCLASSETASHAGSSKS